MGDQRVSDPSEHRLIGRSLPKRRVIVQGTAATELRTSIRSVGVGLRHAPPCELAFDKSNVDRRAFSRVIVVP